MGDQILLSLAIYGLAIVISGIVAVVIRGIVFALPMMSGASKEEKQAAAQPKKAAPAGIPAEHVAAITAAVAAVIRTRHILHIEDQHTGREWMAEGRMIHQTSHYVPRRGRR